MAIIAVNIKDKKERIYIMTMKVELNKKECDIVVSALLDKMKNMREASKYFFEFEGLNEEINKSIADVKKLEYKMVYCPNTLDNEKPEVKENLLMETAMRIQELFCDMSNQFNPDKVDEIDSIERFQIFCDMARKFEKKYYGTEEYDSDWISLTDEVFTKQLKEMFG